MHPFCAAVDWGTSSFRAWLLDERGEVIEQFAFLDVHIGARVDRDMVKPSWPPVPPAMIRIVRLIACHRAKGGGFVYGRAARLTPAAPG